MQTEIESAVHQTPSTTSLKEAMAASMPGVIVDQIEVETEYAVEVGLSFVGIATEIDEQFAELALARLASADPTNVAVELVQGRRLRRLSSGDVQVIGRITTTYPVMADTLHAMADNSLAFASGFTDAYEDTYAQNTGRTIDIPLPTVDAGGIQLFIMYEITSYSHQLAPPAGKDFWQKLTKVQQDAGEVLAKWTFDLVTLAPAAPPSASPTSSPSNWTESPLPQTLSISKIPSSGSAAIIARSRPIGILYFTVFGLLLSFCEPGQTDELKLM